MPPILKPKKIPGIPDIIQPDPSSSDVGSLDVSGGLESGVREGASLLAPLISLYRDKAARDAALQEFKQSVYAFAKNYMRTDSSGTSNTWTDAADSLAKNFPNVAAHMRHSIAPAVDQPGFQAQLHWAPIDKYKEPAILRVHQNALDRLATDPAEAQATMYHEATHAAQALGNKDSPYLYTAADPLTDYRSIPYEKSAFYRGDLAAQGITSASQDPNRIFSYDYISNRLKNMGISLDVSGIGGVTPEVKLRKWGMPATPENYLPIESLPSDLQGHIAGFINRSSPMNPNYYAFTRASRPATTATQGMVDLLNRQPAVTNALVRPDLLNLLQKYIIK